MNKLIPLLVLISPFVLAENQTITSFSKAKKTLETKVYQNHRVTLYCGATFDSKKSVTPPDGFASVKHVKRS